MRRAFLAALILSTALSGAAQAGGAPATLASFGEKAGVPVQPVSYGQEIDRKKLSQLRSKGKSILSALERMKAGGGSGEALSEEEAALLEKQREWQAEDSQPYDVILTLKRRGKTIRSAMIGIQQGTQVYLPLQDIASALLVYSVTDIQAGTVSGFAGGQDNTFSIDIPSATYTVRGERFPLPPDAAFVKDFGQGLGDMFVTADLLNALWNYKLTLNFAELALLVDTPQLLPFEREEQRRESQELFLARNNERPDAVDETFIPNDYKLIGKPAVNITQRTRWDDVKEELTQNINTVGVNDLLYASADYNAQVEFNEEDGYDINNLRLRLTRRADKGDELPLGLKLAQGGDLSVKPPELIARNVIGSGVSVSNKPFRRGQNFDIITVEGVGQPGWEVEVYNGSQLENFGTIGANGEYRFEGIQLYYGVNEIKTILYGPQGEVEERIQEYDISDTLLASGETVVEASALDANASLIEVDDNGERSTDGFFHTVSVKSGFNDVLSPFFTSTSTESEDGRKNYVSAGANFSALGGLGLVEGYKDLGGGTALDTRFSRRFANLRLNARTSFFNDFESEEANFDDRAKNFEGELRATTTVPSALGSIGLSADGVHTTFEDGTDTTRYGLGQSFALPGLRFSNRTTTQLEESAHRATTGRLSASTRLSDAWSARSSLNYRVFPETNLDSTRFELRYADLNRFTSSFDVNQDLDNEKNTTLGADASYDFGRFLAGLGMSWDLDEGFDAIFRTTMSLGPLGEDGSYITSSDPLTGKTALRGRIFRDHNVDGVFNEGDEPVQGASLRVNGLGTEATGEEGTLYALGPAGQGLVTVKVDQDSLGDDLLIPASDQYTTVLRPVTAPFVDIPITVSGSLDGNVYFEDGKPTPTLRLQLVDSDGGVVKETVADFSGYYTFDAVRPGRYRVQADPSHNLRVAGADVTISADDPFVYGINLEVAGTAGAAQASPKGLLSSLKNIIERSKKRKQTI